MFLDKFRAANVLRRFAKRCKSLKIRILELEDRCSIQLSYGHTKERRKPLVAAPAARPYFARFAPQGKHVVRCGSAIEGAALVDSQVEDRGLIAFEERDVNVISVAS